MNTKLFILGVALLTCCGPTARSHVCGEVNRCTFKVDRMVAGDTSTVVHDGRRTGARVVDVDVRAIVSLREDIADFSKIEAPSGGGRNGRGPAGENPDAERYNGPAKMARPGAARQGPTSRREVSPFQQTTDTSIAVRLHGQDKG